ncbi:hypothetical protein R6138_04190 [Ralstonia thomasii]|uniref:DUF7338 family protein n=1 Tax=Ralstonia thomasii TaxID=3058596 RepID=UPI0028F5E925|nr:hypothetical protein [Ralstonia sp. LMG 18095]CAJ0898195.1 hypothetical protein R6138_04190 [Ralstonia sp. LMG 18095]
MYFRFAFLALVNVAFTVLAWGLSPLVALFVRSDGYLPYWLLWFQTQDAPIDAGWRDGYFGTYKTDGVRPTGWRLYWYRVCWLCRNPAYGFCYWPLGLPYNPDDWVIHARHVEGTDLRFLAAITKDGKHFCYYDADTGEKFGYKLYWATDDAGNLMPKMDPGRGPDNRLPFCFTPRIEWD